MSVFTAFFCGTCSNSYDFIDGEVVATLARNHPGRELVDWVICDGPGSGTHKGDENKDRRQGWHDGTQTAMMRAQGIEPDRATAPSAWGITRNIDLSTKWTAPGKHWRLNGKVTGAGWESNVEHVLAVIRGEAEWSAGGGLSPQMVQEQQVRIFRKANGPITKVNAIGWSRGAVSCHILANAIADSTDPRLKAVTEVNIFAIDPVPGPGLFSPERVKLPKIVRNYFAVYARDELQYMFRPTLPKVKTGYTHFQALLVPGVHATPSGDPYAQQKHQGTSGKVTRHLAEQCLAQWGTPLNQRLDYDDLQLLAKYDKLLRNDNAYRSGTSWWNKGQQRKIRIGTKYAHTTVNKVPEFRMNEDLDVFINWHHREVFERLFRPVANRVYGPDRGRPTAGVGYRCGMNLLAQAAPHLHHRLTAYEAEHA
jgi:hypothetical protein